MCQVWGLAPIVLGRFFNFCGRRPVAATKKSLSLKILAVATTFLVVGTKIEVMATSR